MEGRLKKEWGWVMIGMVEMEVVRRVGSREGREQIRDKRLGVNRKMQKHLAGGKWAG